MMRTIREPGEYELEAKKSRFLCAVARATDETQAREFIRSRRKLHHAARHHCSAYVLGDAAETQKSSDDGEPAGTAGIPMLDVLRRNHITNTVTVVSRYFGGVLLGAGGLVRAYGGAVSSALERIGLVERRPARLVSTVVDYGLAGRLEHDLRSAGHDIVEVVHTDHVRFELRVPDDAVDAFEVWLAEASGGAATVRRGALIYTEADL